MKRRVLALLLVCLMLVSAVPAAVMAAGEDGIGAGCPGAGEIHTLHDSGPYKFIKSQAANCKTGAYGYEEYQCETCGDHFLVNVVEAEHTWAPEIAGKPATCLNVGYRSTIKCEVCGVFKVVDGEVMDGGEILPTGHNWVETKKTGTCLTGGVIYETCSYCGETRETPYAAGKGGHQLVRPNDSYIVEPTCVDEGLVLYMCTLCKEEFEVPVKPSPLFHTGEVIEVQAKDPTCTAVGWKHGYRCSTCGAEYEKYELVKHEGKKDQYVLSGPTTLQIAKKPHSFPTKLCYKDTYCSVCGASQGLANHTWVYVAPTCTADGYFECAYKSAGCTATRSVASTDPQYANAAYKALGHTGFDKASDDSEYKVWLVEPKCDGSQDGARMYQCERCSCLIVEATSKSKDYQTVKDFVKAYELKAEFDGTKASVLVYTETSPLMTAAVAEYLKGDHVRRTATVDGNCVDKGYTYTYCLRGDDCTSGVPSNQFKIGDTFYPVVGDEPVTVISAALTNINPSNHKNKSLIKSKVYPDKETAEFPVKATCTTDGTTGYCSYCRDKGETILPATGHKMTFVNAVAPTCEKPGTPAYYACSNAGCTHKTNVDGSEFVEDKNSIPALGHELKKVAGAAPTCTVPGRKDYWECKRCGTAFKDENGSEKYVVTAANPLAAQIAIPALGHEYVKTVVPVTCEEMGYTLYNTCSRCNATEAFIIADAVATGHVWEEIKDAKGNPTSVAPTCTTDGVDNKRCTVCKTERKTVVPKTGHENKEGQFLGYGDTIDCVTAAGITNFKCNNAKCGKEIKKVHGETKTFRTAMVCGETAGYEIVVCLACNEQVSVKIVEEMAAKHDYQLVTVEPTCGQDGYEVEACVNCGAQKGEAKVLPATGAHTYGEWETVTEPKCEATGTKKQTCTVCGNEVTEEIEALGHDEGKWVVVEDSTLTKEGKMERRCTRCDKVLETKPIETKEGFTYVVTAGNANAPEGYENEYADGSLVAVTVSLSSAKEIDIWGILFNLVYDTDVVEYVNAEFISESIPANMGICKAVDNDGYVSISLIAPNGANGKTQNIPMTEEAVVVVYFRIKNTDATSTTFTVDGSQTRNNDLEKDAYYTEVKSATIDISVLGDYNGDGVITLADYLYAQQIVLREIEGVTYDVTVDVNKDGKVDLADLEALLALILGEITYEDLVAFVNED